MALTNTSENPAPPPEDKKKKARRRLMDVLSWKEFTGQIQGDSKEEVKKTKAEIDRKK